MGWDDALAGSPRDQFTQDEPMTKLYRPFPPLDEVRRLLTYYPNTGAFQWTMEAGRKVRGKVTGCKDHGCGYGSIRIGNTLYLSHRVAWFMQYGEDPGDMQVDHINENKLDNRIANLRLATNAENMKNVTAYTTNSSGYKGVSWMKSYGKWEGYVCYQYKKYGAGFFDDLEEAAAAVAKLRNQLHGTFANHG
jgi:hypothetical protein